MLPAVVEDIPVKEEQPPPAVPGNQLFVFDTLGMIH
jgi:hypothetical protein